MERPVWFIRNEDRERLFYLENCEDVCNRLLQLFQEISNEEWNRVIEWINNLLSELMEEDEQE